jgi:hypothetical protein
MVHSLEVFNPVVAVFFHCVSEREKIIPHEEPWLIVSFKG